MTYAAIFRLACLASQHALTEDEIAASLRLACVAYPTITVNAVERAIRNVLTTRVVNAA